ncbi:MAG: aspartyl protease family protein, partial [Chitinophagaceae bacterium]
HGKDTLHFLFDSGCEINLLSLPVASRMGLNGNTDAGLSGWSNKMTVMPQASVNSMEIGWVTIPYPGLYLESLSGASIQGIPVDGVLGYDLLKRYIVKIDFQHKEMSIYRSGNFHYPPGGDLLKLGMNYRTPTLEATLVNDQGQPFTSTYHVITGGNFGLLLNEKYVEKYGLNKTLHITGKTIRQDLLQPIAYTECSVPTFNMGRSRFYQIPALYSKEVNDTAPDREIAGAIGVDVWKRFTMIINLPEKELYLIKR